MGGGLESRCVGSVYGADGAVARHHPPFIHASSILFYFYQIPNISRRVLTVTFFIPCFHNYVTSNKQAN